MRGFDDVFFIFNKAKDVENNKNNMKREYI